MNRKFQQRWSTIILISTKLTIISKSSNTKNTMTYLSGWNKLLFLFAIGGPGSGKGTQCQRMIERYKETVHLSMGDILRNQIAQQGSADEKWGMIGTLVQKGEMAPQVKNLKY